MHIEHPNNIAATLITRLQADDVTLHRKFVFTKNKHIESSRLRTTLFDTFHPYLIERKGCLFIDLFQKSYLPRCMLHLSLNGSKPKIKDR